MYKISFKNPNSKVVKTYSDGKVTIVTLNGVMSVSLINLYWDCPSKIRLWSIDYPNVKMYGDTIIVTGKAICSEQDENNPKIGERIAESRAKLSLYKFMRTLLKKIYEYKYNELFGNFVLRSDENSYLDEDTILGQFIKYSKLYEKENIHLHTLL